MNLSKHLLPVSALVATAIAAILLAGPAAPEARAAGGGGGGGGGGNTNTNTVTVTNAVGGGVTNLYAFTNAAYPASTLTQVGLSFYGTTTGNGSNVSGTLFRFAPRITNTVTTNGTTNVTNTVITYVYTNLYTFQATNSGPPSSPLYLYTNGNFYGTTSISVTNATTNNPGTNNYGTIYSYTPSSGQVSNVYVFSGTDGADPVGGLAQGTNGVLYGVTYSGGNYGYGTVYALAPSGTLTSLGSFNGSNGAYPQAGLVSNWDGNLYGTTTQGGSNGDGTVYQVTPGGAVNYIASFSNYNGSYPLGLVAANGNLVGTAFHGGNNQLGAVFAVTTSGTIWLVASFDLANGSSPEGAPLLAADGFLYGTTLEGGTNGKGVIYKLSTNATGGTNGIVWTNGTSLVNPGGFYTNPASTLSNVWAFGANGATPQAGLIQGSDYDLYGTTTGGSTNGYGSIFKLTFPLTITGQPTNVNYQFGGNAVFSVLATGSAGGGASGLSYQWQWNGTNITTNNYPNGVVFSGWNKRSLTISNEDIYDAGSYSVIVSNASGTVQSSPNAHLVIPLPSVTISAPRSTNSPELTVSGTATIPGGGPTDVIYADKLTNVVFEVSNALSGASVGTWSNAIPEATNWSKWSATVTLGAGSNTITAYGVDVLGNAGTNTSAVVFYWVTNTLELQTNGYGSITNSAKPNPLVIGSNSVVVGTNYTVKAVPTPSNLFIGWTGTITNNANPLTFTTQSNMTLVANFVTNFFIGAAGSYNGLFYVTNTNGSFAVSNGVGAQSSGLLRNLKVTTVGAYSARLYLAGTNYIVTGNFDASGNATNLMTNSSRQTLTLAMTLNHSSSPAQVTGTVKTSGSGWTASLLAELATNSASKEEYALLIPPANNSPAGYGCLLITNNSEGTATVTGRLADGTAFSESVAISATGNVDVYAVPYTNGLLLGRLSLASGIPQGNLTWIRRAGTNRVFTSGFTNTLAVAQSELWTNPPPGTAALTCSSGLLMISNASTNLIFYVAVNANNTLSKLGSVPTNAGSLRGSINPKTGLLSVSIGSSPGIAAATGYGIVQQNTNSLKGSNNVAGYVTTATNTGLLLLQTNLSAVSPIIIKQPVSQKFMPGSNVQFSVQAIGSPALNYQWRLDGTNLTDGGTFSGSASNVLTVGPEVLASDAGSYSVVVSNSIRAVTSSVVTLTVPQPSITITSPRAEFDTTAAILPVAGKASVKGGTAADVVTNVVCGVNGGAWENATPAAPGNWSNWSTSVTLTAGSNTVFAYSVDPLGTHSPTNSVEVFYTTYGTLTLLTNGDGTIKPGFANARDEALRTNGSVYTNLVVGASYTVTAVPKANNLFSNWSDTASLTLAETTNKVLKFTMAPDMMLTANFATNSFLGAAGIYNGLFYDTNAVSTESSGLLGGLTVKTLGAYSGTLYIGGAGYGVAGQFDLAGDTSSQVKHVAHWGTLTLAMHLDWNQSPPQITGTVRGTNGGGWTAELTNELAGSNLKSAEYTMLIPQGANTNSPSGYGYALMTNHLGKVIVSGHLADGTAFATTLTESKTHHLPFYATPYTNGGLLLGWLDLSSNAPAGNLKLIRPAAASGLFTGGYTNVVTVQSSAWTNLGTKTNAISLPSGGQLAISGGFLAGPLDFSVVYTNNTFAKENVPGNRTNSLTLSIAAKTGLLSVTFGNGNGTNTTTGTGAILQNQNSGAGFFVTPTNAGSIQLTP